MLMMDGGNMDIVDIRDSDEGKIDVYIRYLGLAVVVQVAQQELFMQ